jgi:hypothetical protein
VEECEEINRYIKISLAHSQPNKSTKKVSTTRVAVIAQWVEQSTSVAKFEYQAQGALVGIKSTWKCKL